MDLNTSQTQHKRILFLISLLQTPEFTNDKEEIDECLKELRELKVDVRERIRQEDLAIANEYDVVIVVAHYDDTSDMLVLSDGMMPINDFVSYLPQDFSGLIDFCSCNSITAFQTIKNRCPSCLAKVSLKTIPLLRRIIIYPSVIERFLSNDSIDYDTAFRQVSNDYDEILGKISTGRTSEPEMTSLGQDMTTVYAPNVVKRNVPFQVIVFVHYESEKIIIKNDARQWQTDAIIRDSKELMSLKEGEKVKISLDFITSNERFIHVDEGKERVREISSRRFDETFVITVLPGFPDDGFLAFITISNSKDEYIRSHNFDISVGDCEDKTPAKVDIETTNTYGSETVLSMTKYTKKESGNVVEPSLIDKLIPIFFSDKEKIDEFLVLVKGMTPRGITDIVNEFIGNKWISTYGNSHKGRLWKILSDAGIYTASKSYWNSMVNN